MSSLLFYYVKNYVEAFEIFEILLTKKIESKSN